jgi:hypothetical protein
MLTEYLEYLENEEKAYSKIGVLRQQYLVQVIKGNRDSDEVVDLEADLNDAIMNYIDVLLHEIK